MLTSAPVMREETVLWCKSSRKWTVSTMSQSHCGILNARMCGLKQGMNEPIKAYYERMADISVKLEQYHGDRFRLGELSLMKKDCFYAGLKEHNKYLVSHMKDRDQYGPVQMLKEIREQEDSHYPVNTTPKPMNMDNQNKNTTHYDRKKHIL